MKKSQQKFLLILFTAAIFLLLVNVLVKLLPGVGETDQDFSMNQEDFEKRFLLSLKSFGLKDEWIKEKLVKGNKSSSDYHFFIIMLPNDLSIPEVLLDITDVFRNDSVKIESVEKKSAGETSLLITGNKKHLLGAEFKYSDKIKREAGTAAFVIEGVMLDNLEDSVFVESSDYFNLLLIPSAENLKHLKYIKEQRKDFSILLNDDISDPTYKLNASYSKLRLLNAIKAFSVDYSGASFFIVDDNSDFFKSARYQFFQKELEKRNVRLKKISDFIDLRENESLQQSFDEELKNLGTNGTKIFLVKKDEYLSLKPLISLYKKRGAKIVKTSAVRF